MRSKLRHLVVYDNDYQEFFKMSTAWSNEEVESIPNDNNTGIKWNIISEYTTAKEAMQKAKEFNK